MILVDSFQLRTFYNSVILNISDMALLGNSKSFGLCDTMAKLGHGPRWRICVAATPCSVYIQERESGLKATSSSPALWV